MPPAPASSHPDAPLWSWALEAIGERAETMLEHLDGARAGEDIEAVHDMRVWSRRLVAAMCVFESCFPERRYRKLRKEARRVTRALGRVRDLDVILDHYRILAREAGEREQIGIEFLAGLLEAEREDAREPMLRELDRLVEGDYLRRLRKYLHAEAQAYSVGLSPQVVALGPRAHAAGCVDCERSFREAAHPLLAARWDRLLEFEPYVEQPAAAEEQHRMRIAAKWLRYTMELFAPAYADELKEPISRVKKLQELLGELHDSDVRRDLLRSHLPVLADPAAAGMLDPSLLADSLQALLEREEQTRRECYEAVRKEWRKLARRGFLRALPERLRNPDAVSG